MYLSDDLKIEINQFKRLHENYSITIKDKTIKVGDLEDKIAFMLMTSSYVMDSFEEEFFESYTITDKAISNKQDLQLDAYAFISDHDSNSGRVLHLFQFKLFKEKGNGASPVEVKSFIEIMNDMFVHPEFRSGRELNNHVFQDIIKLSNAHINKKRGNNYKVKCHFITNDKGIAANSKKTFEDLLTKYESDKQNKGFDIQIYGETEILDLIREGKIKVGEEVIDLIQDTQYSYRLEDNSKKLGLGLPDKVLIGICNVNELIRLQNKYHYNQLYSENIRLYLGDRAPVNKGIIKTITSDESLWFPYMNNGISIICDKMTIGNPKEKTTGITLTNMQIINGCQTVNALYSAKYNPETKDNFKSSNVLVKIYQINPENERFKLNIIKATNNQNAVKTPSLFANDRIHIEIQKILENLNCLYDRKGESKNPSSSVIEIIDMVQAALAYRAVFKLEAQKLRAKIGQSRVFQQEDYESIYKDEYLEEEKKPELIEFSLKLLLSFIILDSVKIFINNKSNEFIESLPIIKKSSYYLAGLYYELDKAECEKVLKEAISICELEKPNKERSSNFINSFRNTIQKNMYEKIIYKLIDLYKSIKETEKLDIDNLLKSEYFNKEYQKFISDNKK